MLCFQVFKSDETETDQNSFHDLILVFLTVFVEFKNSFSPYARRHAVNQFQGGRFCPDQH